MANLRKKRARRRSQIRNVRGRSAARSIRRGRVKQTRKLKKAGVRYKQQPPRYHR